MPVSKSQDGDQKRRPRPLSLLVASIMMAVALAVLVVLASGVKPIHCCLALTLATLFGALHASLCLDIILIPHTVAELR